MCGIKNLTTYIGLVNFEDNLLGKSAKKHEKCMLLSVLTGIIQSPDFLSAKFGFLVEKHIWLCHGRAYTAAYTHDNRYLRIQLDN